MQTLGSALPGLAAPGAIGGASGVPDPTNTRARWHHDEADLSAGGPHQPAISFIHGGSAIPVKNYYRKANPASDGVEILRVLHQSMGAQARLGAASSD